MGFARAQPILPRFSRLLEPLLRNDDLASPTPIFHEEVAIQRPGDKTLCDEQQAKAETVQHHDHHLRSEKIINYP
jgi:hypothetical protein